MHLESNSAKLWPSGSARWDLLTSADGAAAPRAIAIKRLLTANINLHLEIASDHEPLRSSQLNGLSDE